MPSGLTTERPVAESGTLRYNKDDEYLEVYGPGEWQTLRPRVNIHRYQFTEKTNWVVQHNKNTTRFSEKILDENSRQMFASVTNINLNSFEVVLTTATSGYVDVIFDQTNESIIYAN